MVTTRWSSSSSSSEEDSASSSSDDNRSRRQSKAQEQDSGWSSEDSAMSPFIRRASTKWRKNASDTSSDSSSSVRYRLGRKRKADSESPVISKKGRRLEAPQDSSSASSSSSLDENIFLKVSKKRKVEEKDSELFVKPTSINIPRKKTKATKKRRMSEQANTSSAGPSTSSQGSSSRRSRRKKDEKEEAPKPKTKKTRKPEPVPKPQKSRRRSRPVFNPLDHPVLALRGSSIKMFNEKYSKLDQIGQGGFGTVFAGVRKWDSLSVAIKYVKKATALSSTVEGLSGREYVVPTEVVLLLRAGGDSSCVGQNVAVSLIEWFDLGPNLIIIMERPENSTNLWDLVINHTGPLPEDEAKVLMREVISAAVEVMKKGVFHRDIKCSNLLAQYSDEAECGYRVRIVDFGCGSDVEALYEGVYVGTIDYAPPEYCAEGWYCAEPTCVWQLGAVLFELMDPKKNFSTFDLIERKVKIKRGLSKDCRHFLNSCLKLMPIERIPMHQLLSHPWF